MNVFINFSYYLHIGKIRTQRLPIKDECTCCFSNFLIISLSNSSANAWFDIFSFLIPPPEADLSASEEKYKPSKEIFDIHHILDF